MQSMVGRRKVISNPHRRPILPLTTLPSTFRLPRGSRKGGRASPAMWDAIARARPAASFRRHSLEREGDTASRIRSSPLETLIAPRGTDGSNPASSSEESCGRWSPMGLGREQRSRSCEPGRNLREARGVVPLPAQVLRAELGYISRAPAVFSRFSDFLATFSARL